MVHVRVPATLANFGPAFDVLGVAVSVYNEIELETAGRPDVMVHGAGETQLPADAGNLVYRAAAEVARRAGRPGEFRIRCRNAIPIGRGLGSSAAAIVGGAVAANEALQRPLSSDDLLDLAWRMEGHPDNVAAALMGGVVLTSATDGRLAWTRLIPAWTAALVVAVPDFAVPTALARAALPVQVPLADAVANVGRTARLVTSLLTGRADLLRIAMDDSLHQPYRRALVPGMDQVFAAAKEAGAFGAALCGSGPSVVAVVPPEVTETVGTKMVAAFVDAGSSATYVVVRVDERGATVLPVGSSQ